MNKKYLDPQILTEYVEALCEKNNHPDTLKQALLNQIGVLRQRYGNEIPKDDFLTLMAQQQNALKTGYRKQPVDILEFLISTEYLNATTLRPVIKNTLIDIFEGHNHCYEVVLSGGTGIGKTYLACCAYAYHIYHLSCLYNPQMHYNLSDGSQIVFSIQSLTKEKAERNFNEFYGLVHGAPYFKEYFPLQGTAKKYSVFPNNIVVKPIASTNASAMSENILCAFIDEANFMQVIKGSAHQALDEQYYDQATKLYRTIKDRIQNRFKNFKTGEWPGKIYLASSANHKEDFIQNKIKESKKVDYIYVMDYALWEAKPEIAASGEYFWVQMPTELDAGSILEKKPEIMTDDVIKIPVELKSQFDEDLHAAIRNVAGRPISRESKFIPSHTLINNIKRYNQYYQSNQIFTVQQICLSDVIDLKSLLNIPFIEAINPYFTFHSHCDVGISNDACGIAIGATVGAKIVKSTETIDLDTKEKKEEIESTMPIYAMFGMLRINPPKNGQIELEAVQKLYFAIKEYLINLKSFTADGPLNIVFVQTLRKYGGMSGDYLSVDKKPDAYIGLKNSLYENRCWLPEHETFKEEIKGLMFDIEKNKVDHSRLHSKDVADAVTGTVMVLSKRKATYKKTDKPMTLGEMKKMSGVEEKKEKRPDLGLRPRSGNRPSNWKRRR